MRFIYACVLLFFTFGAVHGAEPVADQEEQYQLGLKAYEAEDYDKAYEIWLPLGEAGYADSQYRLGYMYRYGLGVSKDLYLAQVWFVKTFSTNAKAQMASILLSGELGNTYEIDGICWLYLAKFDGDIKAIEALEYLISKEIPGGILNKAKEKAEERKCEMRPLQ